MTSARPERFITVSLEKRGVSCTARACWMTVPP